MEVTLPILRREIVTVQLYILHVVKSQQTDIIIYFVSSSSVLFLGVGVVGLIWIMTFAVDWLGFILCLSVLVCPLFFWGDFFAYIYNLYARLSSPHKT